MSRTNSELLETLEKLQKRYPHWRFGQLIVNVAAWAGKKKTETVWDVSDEALLRAAKKHLKETRSGAAVSLTQRAMAALARMRRAAKAAGKNNITSNEIDAEIRRTRRERRALR